jgi:hypothetical protein
MKTKTMLDRMNSEDPDKVLDELEAKRLLGRLAARLTARAVDINCAHARTEEEKTVKIPNGTNP